ncbi:MAG TPA: glycosyl transferase family protein [Acetobacteraceae bacterium]
MDHTASEDRAAVADEHRFAQYVRTLGRGPGRSRNLTRDEARDALGMVLGGEADPHQVGAFLMLLRYRGEDPDEMAGLVDAGRASLGAGLPAGCRAVDLDWPSYGAGRSRGEPWFLLAALALGRAGYRVLMHGSNEFSRGTAVADGLAALGLRAAADRGDAVGLLDEVGFAYLPLASLCPELDRLLRLRRLLGLRSPLNTAARLLNPFDARAGVDGVFHPGYIALHLGAAERLGRERLVVVKGGGGEAERSAVKTVAAHWFQAGEGTGELSLAAGGAVEGEAGLAEVWRGAAGVGEATAVATVGLGLLALGVAGDGLDERAARVWAGRHGALDPIKAPLAASGG